jgi:hypothetical protein
MDGVSADATGVDRLEYRFRWNDAEHRRFYRALQRETRRKAKYWLFFKIWMGIVGSIYLLSLVNPRTQFGPATLWPLAAVLVFIGLDRWGLPYWSARAYARAHAPCIPNDQVRVLDRDGIAATCTTSSASVRWPGVVRVEETPEFFLFFTTPRCAIQLPKRAVGDVPQLRAWLDRAAAWQLLAGDASRAHARTNAPVA